MRRRFVWTDTGINVKYCSGIPCCISLTPMRTITSAYLPIRCFMGRQSRHKYTGFESEQWNCLSLRVKLKKIRFMRAAWLCKARLICCGSCIVLLFWMSHYIHFYSQRVILEVGRRARDPPAVSQHLRKIYASFSGNLSSDDRWPLTFWDEIWHRGYCGMFTLFFYAFLFSS